MMYGWMDGWVGGFIDEWVGGWMDGSMRDDGWKVHGRMDDG